MLCRKIFLFISFFIFATIAHAEVIPVESKISAVTIYPDSVLITREASVKLLAGEHQVVFKNIKSAFDQNSLTVSGEGTARVKISGALLEEKYLKEASDVRLNNLLTKLQEVDDSIADQNYQIETIQSQKEFVNSVKLFSGQQLPKDLVTKVPSSVELEATLGFIGSQLTALNQRRTSTEQKLRDLNKERNVIEQEIQKLQGNMQGVDRSISITLVCETAGNFTVRSSYLIYGASWFPVYDARASLSKDSIELTTFALVRQSSGEDWKDVELTLSTARPSVGGRLPYIEPWFVRPYNPPMPMAKEMRRGMMAAAVQTEAFNYKAMDAVGSALEEQEVNAPASLALSAAASKGISIVYKIPARVTINSDGSERKLPVNSQNLKANFEYSTYPRLSPSVYLGSRVTNSADLQLLAGEINVFLEGDFVGRSGIDNIGPGEEFDLYLGVDENVKIDRKELEKKTDDVFVVGISAPTVKTSYKYRLTAENYKSKAIRLNLFEAMPISENDRIKTKVNEVSLQPQDKDWKARKGVWRWELKLEPKAKKEIFYSYSIEHPREMQIE